MDHSVLESVIKITNQRDVDSLEYSLVATLAEMLPVNNIGIYRLVDDGYAVTLEEDLLLHLKDNKNEANNIEWSASHKKITRDDDIQKCMNSGLPVRFEKNNRLYRLITPIRCGKKVVAALNITSREDLSDKVKLLEGMIRIYENYLFILNESERDKLTGLYNRRTFDKKLDRLLQIQRNNQIRLVESDSDKEKRSLRPYSETWLAIIDIDDFKRVNDTYGHMFGDGVLLLLSHKMKLCFRQSDYLFRFGGEEFVVILEPHPKGEAFATLERFRQAIAEHTFPLVGKVSVSIGYARITEADYPPAILDSADKALYYAKQHGKNCVYNYETLVADGAVEKTRMSSSINVG